MTAGLRERARTATPGAVANSTTRPQLTSAPRGARAVLIGARPDHTCMSRRTKDTMASYCYASRTPSTEGLGRCWESIDLGANIEPRKGRTESCSSR